MFYRRRIILSLLQCFEGNLEKIRLQKLLFLTCKNQEKSAYDFVPFKYGCYSYSANADLKTMAMRGLLNETDSSFQKADKINYLKSLTTSDFNNILEIKKLYGNMNTDAIMRHTYVNFPYWATKSVKASDILTSRELEVVKKFKPTKTETILFTIGYEGISLEEYLNRLIQNDVRALIDVRNNPISMKFGFSKSMLKGYCESLGIIYHHYPQVGILSGQRRELRNQEDYDDLFAKYRKLNLVETIPTQNAILQLLEKYKRIALTCFESNICQCHRKPLAESIQNLPGFTFEIKHI